MIVLMIFLNINQFVVLQSFSSKTSCEKARHKAIEPEKLSCVYVPSIDIEEDD